MEKLGHRLRGKGYLLMGGLLLLCSLAAGAAGIWHGSKAEAAAIPDIAQHWSRNEVQRLVDSHVILGYPDGTFRPDDIISAAEYMTLLARARSLPQTAGQTSHWAAGYFQAALNAGWYDYDEVPPVGDTFDRPISRQLAVKLLMNGFLPDARGEYGVWAGQIRDWNEVPGRYYDPVLAAYETGLVLGDGGYFRPLRGLTRAEAATLLCRALDMVQGGGNASPVPLPAPTTAPAPSPAVSRLGGVSKNGALKVIGTQLSNANGEPVVLRGMSSHGIQWYSQFTDSAAIKATADRGANLFRVAMYTEAGGYLQNPQDIWEKTVAAIDAAIAQDFYVIVDWHILSDGDPLKHVDAAKEFFQKVAARYADTPAVLYEICNEPNGSITWRGNVKPYAEAVIPVIRAAAPDSVILVGSPTWSQDIHEAAKNPLTFENIMYTCHFYAGTHTQWLRDRIDAAMKAGLPIFVSEWGTSDASGNGGPYPEETARWLEFMAKRNISWANWSYADKNEASAALRPGAKLSDGLQDNELSASGKLVFATFS